MLKVQALREMTREELVHKRNDLLEEQFNLRMRRSIKSLDNPLRLRQIRREVAKIMTVLNEDRLDIRKVADKSASVLSSSGAESSKSKRETD
jgi:large subunit ribosomal protein L29